MRVAIDVSAVHATSGGVLRYVQELVRHLPAAEVEPVLIDRRARHDPERDLFNGDGHPTVLARSPSWPPARLLWEQFALAPTVRRIGGIPVLHSPHYTMPRRLPLLHGRATGTPAHVVTIHDLTFFTRPELHSAAKRRLFRSAIRYAARHADALVCVSDRTATLLNRHVEVAAHIVVAPHGIDRLRFRPPSLQTDQDDARVLERHGVRPPYLLWLGAIAPHKNLETLLKAFAAARRTQGLDELRLVIGGQSWPGAWESVEQWASPSVQRIGFVPESDVAPLLRRAEVFCYPSLEEGFGLPVLEALACGTPVLTSEDSAMADLAGPFAVTVDPRSVGAMCEGLVRSVLAADGDAAARVAHARTFTWERSAAAHAKAYRLAIDHAGSVKRRTGPRVAPGNGR